MASTVITIEPSAVQKKIRVAAYCRVLSSSEDQLHSFAAQVQHYTKFIRSNDQMELVDIYADEGLTGTKTAKREEFNRMIADCKKGRIDRVLTKSLSRFARNTADALMYARILRENGVSILFEKEKHRHGIYVKRTAPRTVRRTGTGGIHLHIKEYEVEY